MAWCFHACSAEIKAHLEEKNEEVTVKEEVENSVAPRVAVKLEATASEPREPALSQATVMEEAMEVEAGLPALAVGSDLGGALRP